jgi:hypothetical protein
VAVTVTVPGFVQRTSADIRLRINSSAFGLWLAVFLPLLGLYLLTLRVNAFDMSPDTVSVTSSAWQLAHHGTPRLPATAPHYDAWMIPSGSGHIVSNREPGLVWLAAPFYLLIPSASIFNVAPASIAAALIASTAMAFLAVLLRRLVSNETAFVAALIAGTATTTWAVSGTSLWPHTADQLYLVLAMLAVAAGKHTRAGVAFALAVLTRPPLAVAAAVVGLWHAWTTRSFRPLLGIGAATALGLGVLLVYAHVYWHGGLDRQYEAVGGGFVTPFTDLSPHALGDFAINVLGTLISPGRGVLFGAPFLVVLACGLTRAWAVAPTWTRSAAVGGLLYLAVQLKANPFGGGATFWSYRYPIETLTALAPLLVLSWREWVSRAARRRAAFTALVTFAIALQAVGAICFRRTETAWWSTNDFTAVVSDRRFVAVPILFIGYVAAAIVYRRMSTSTEIPAMQSAVAANSV